MFCPKTSRLEKLSELFPERIKELEEIFDQTTYVYIDYANVRPWSEKLGWHVDIKRLKQFFNSFSEVKSIKFYNGTLLGNIQSEKFNSIAESLGYDVRTKPVKIMPISIDISSVSMDSTSILKHFIRSSLLNKLSIETITYLNSELKKLNQQGLLKIEDKKCNFDVEIGRDMLLDYKLPDASIFVLWSGDSDFADPLKQLMVDGKKVFIFATARRVAKELNDLRVPIFEINKIKEFICWSREISSDVAKDLLDQAKRTPDGALKL